MWGKRYEVRQALNCMRNARKYQYDMRFWRKMARMYWSRCRQH